MLTKQLPPLGEASAVEFGEMLSGQGADLALRVLEIGGSSFGKEGCAALAKGLDGSPLHVLDITNNEEIDEASMVLLGRAVANTPQLAYLSLHYQAPYGNGDGGTYPQLIELVRAYVAMQKSEEGDTDTLRAFAKAHGLDDSEYDAMSGEAPGGKQEASPGTADYRGSGKNGLPTFDELQRGAAKEMAARQSLEDDDYLPNLKNEL